MLSRNRRAACVGRFLFHLGMVGGLTPEILDFSSDAPDNIRDAFI